MFVLSLNRIAVVAFLACVLASSHSRADEPATAKGPAKQFVEVKFWVIEVSKTKLRTLGFDWDGVKSRPDAAITDEKTSLGFLEALEQNNLARIHARPMIATQSGRKATIDLSPHLKMEVTPTVSDAEHIAFDYHVEVATENQAPAGKAKPRLISASSTELKSGVIQLLSETTIHSRTAKGEPSHSTLLVLAQATIVK